MPTILTLATLGTLWVALSSPIAAQARELHWRAIDVDARLDSAGRLHVTERQSMVFTGDWNGGERRFDIRRRQDFGFESMRRVDSLGEHAMRAGDLSVVDGYDFTGRTTVRWRSRLPDDPPFNDSTITYVLDYSIGGVVQPSGDAWVLNHDFAFPDRDGVIERITVRLVLAPVWRATTAIPGNYAGSNLPPGSGFVVRVPLTWAGANDGPDMNTGAGPVERGLLAVLVLALLGSVARRLRQRERELGRLDPLPGVDAVNEQWLKDHVFSELPEVVGAAWDNGTGQAEVAAILARLCADGRMSSKVLPGSGLLQRPSLHLALLADRERFHGYERTLVDALFAAGETTTDTHRIRERYKRTGFDPAEKVKKPLAKMVAALVPGQAPHSPPRMPTALAFLAAITLLGSGVAREPADAPIAIAGSALALVLYFISVGAAVAWRNRVHDAAIRASWFVLPQAVVVGALLWVLFTGATLAGTLTLAGLALLVVALANSVANQARSRESVERIAYRRRLAVARAFFVRELAQERPALNDAWFPYLIAFGLGEDMDHWFRAFAGEHGVAVTPTAASTGHSSGGSPAHGGGGWTGFGGGGGFAGGGASASWAAAASSMASGVSAPSSSSSGGGGGGGGGSSGGGGGGGW